MMETLPNEMVGEIVLRLDPSSLFQCSQVSHLLRGLSLKQVSPIRTRREFNASCFRGDRLSIIMSGRPKHKWLNSGLFWSCYGYHMDLIKFLLKRGANHWNLGLEGACRGGHRDLSEWMIKIGATDFDSGLYRACQGNHLDLVVMMVDRSPVKYGRWTRIMKGACFGGSIDLVNMAISEGIRENIHFWNWNEGLAHACVGGRLEIVKLMLERGAKIDNINLKDACVGGDRAIVEFIISRLETPNWDLGLRGACQGNHSHLVELMIEKCACVRNTILY